MSTIINIYQYETEKGGAQKKENAAATYLYQADCDGRWCEVYIVFKNKYIKTERFARDLA